MVNQRPPVRARSDLGSKECDRAGPQFLMPFHTLEFHWKRPFECRTVGYKSAEQTAGTTELEAYHFKSASGAVNLSFVDYPTGTTAEHAVDLDLT